MSLAEFVRYLNEMLLIEQFSDYCPNGLQVEGRGQLTKVIGAVTASQSAIDHAIYVGADVLLVHHGFFWRSEDPVIKGAKRARIGSLLSNNVSLLAYHLPLDAHPIHGNNAQLGRLLGLKPEGRFGPRGSKDIGILGVLEVPEIAEAFARRVELAVGRRPLLLGDPKKMLHRAGWCTGGAQNYFETAITEGVDVFLTGEVSEPSYHIAKESGVCFVSAGHHATERYGVQSLGAHIADHFGLEFAFFDEDNPV